MAGYVTVILRRVIKAPSESAAGSCLRACHSVVSTPIGAITH